MSGLTSAQHALRAVEPLSVSLQPRHRHRLKHSGPEPQMWGAVGFAPKRGQVRQALQRARCEDAGDLAQTQTDPGSSSLPPPVGYPPLVKTEQRGRNHVAVVVGVQVHTSEVVADHRRLPESIRVTVDDSEPAGEEETERFLNLSGPSVPLRHQWPGHLTMVSTGPSFPDVRDRGLPKLTVASRTTCIGHILRAVFRACRCRGRTLLPLSALASDLIRCWRGRFGVASRRANHLE